MKLKHLILVLTVFCVTNVLAQSTINKIKDNGKIVVGTSGDQHPFSFKDANGELTGMDIELAQALADGMDVELEIKQIPFPKLLDELKANNIDLVLSGMSMKIDRNMEFAFAGPYFKTEKAILSSVKGGLKKSDITSLNLAAVKLVSVVNSTSELIIKQYYPEATHISVETFDEGLNKIKSGEATGMIADFESVEDAVLRDKTLKMMYVDDISAYDPLGMAVNPDDMLFVNLLENYLDAVDSSGFLEYLKKKYFER